MGIEEDVKRHYTTEALDEKVFAALKKAGMDPAVLSKKELSTLDEFHIGGQEQSVEMAEFAGINQDMHILDVGSGLGGPARFLAERYGCRVTGLDFNEEWLRIAEEFTRRSGLSELIDYRHSDAREMPFQDDVFDVVWIQQSMMNIPEKEKVFAEVYRVMKPAGCLAILEAVDGPGGELLLPNYWAPDLSLSFLNGADELREQIKRSGLIEERWEDYTETSLAWFRRLRERIESGQMPILGFFLMFDNSQELTANQIRNLNDRRFLLVQGLFRKPQQPAQERA